MDDIGLLIRSIIIPKTFTFNLNRMFVFDKIEGTDIAVNEFEITGSTYEPIGEVFLKGQKVKSADYDALQELGTICIMCNDSAIDFNEVILNNFIADIFTAFLGWAKKIIIMFLYNSSNKYSRKLVKLPKPLLLYLLRR